MDADDDLEKKLGKSGERVPLNLKSGELSGLVPQSRDCVVDGPDGPDTPRLPLQA